MSYLDEGSCDKEEEYRSISKGDKELEESTEAPDMKHGYNSLTTMHVSPKVRSRDLSPSEFVNTSSTNAVNSRQRSLSSQNFVPTIPTINTMAGIGIKLPIFNRNGLEDP